MMLWVISVAMLAQDGPQWSSFAKLQEARSNACAVRLSDPGKVLVTGGTGTAATSLASVEIFSTSLVPQYAAPLNSARSGHTCTLLRDGRVLVTGGSFAGANAEIYDPALDFWLPVASAGPTRAGSTATVLRDGRVLIAGGYDDDGALLPYAEIFDPNSNRFTASRGQMNQPRRNHAAALLPDGRVAITGGIGLDGQALRSTELFDPLTGIIWTGPDLITARQGHASATLADGRVMVAGGGTNLVETLDLQGQRWTTSSARLNGNGAGPFTALVIPGNGNVFFAGPAAAEVYSAITNSFRTIPSGEVWTGAALAAGLDGDLLAFGGTAGAQDLIQRIGFPALTFDAGVYYPRQQIRFSGRNLPPGANIAMNLEFVRGAGASATASNTPQFRIFAPRVTANTEGAFGPVLLMETQIPDTGTRLRLTATGPQQFTLVREVPIKYPGELTLGIPSTTVEGQNLALMVYVKPVEAPTTPKPSGAITTTFGPLTMVEALNEATLSSSFSNAKLPAGALSVTAIYPGDAYYDFAQIRTTLGVASRTPSVDIVTSTLTPQIGVPFQVYAQVRVDSATAEVTGGPAPSGTVTIYESGVPLGVAKVQWTTAFPVPQLLASREFTPTRFEPGLRFSATYSGDANYRPSSSGVISPQVQKAQPNLVVSAIPSIFNLIPAVGPPVRFHCDVPLPVYVGFAFPGALNLSSNVFTISATTSAGTTVPLGAGNLEVVRPGNATAVATVTLPNDAIRIQANFAGDGSLRAATSSSLPVAIIPVPVKVELSASAVDPATDALFLTAAISNDAGRGCQVQAPQGEAEFFLGTTSLGRAPLNASGVASLRILRPLVEGPQALFVRYYGDPLHTPTDSMILTVKFD